MSKKSYVDYWKEREESSLVWNKGMQTHTIATWNCGCKLGYSVIAYSPIHRCNKHNDMWRWFGLPIPPHNQLKEVEQAGIITLSYPDVPTTGGGG